MHIHILGICGTFMGGIAALAKALGHHVTGSDANVYPPMSTQLEQLGISLTQGYDPAQLEPAPDLVVIGNAMSRGNPAVEYVLDRNLPYTSGPQWLLENLLKDRWVLAVSGTHGKTTTSSMLAWVLEYAGLNPGFLIGGVPENFGISARLGDSPFFVIEADEYDSAFFDKRSKFVHYRPRTLIINNLEFDHADIFDNLAAIQKQFHHLLRMVPGNGLVISPAQDHNVEHCLQMGCWTPIQRTGKEWQLAEVSTDGSSFDILLNGVKQGRVDWLLQGEHNRQNALMAVAAARHAGVQPALAIEALNSFKNVKRRMEVKGKVADITLYDDFAHHPTAIAMTIAGLRAKVGTARILAVLEPRSNTMKQGVFKDQLANAWQQADSAFIFEPEGLRWSLQQSCQASAVPSQVYNDLDALQAAIIRDARPGDHILVMSNGGFGGLHQKLLNALEDQHGL
ncbi:UDP-N-acetylmuramate:L-alanyl-gamma-D-glutamyl-meso-diaminopimelate ligase [Bowmanella yangjiangensis]|uniref:UDP-N-acetylmuramate--L-alanyl-gamma-D-glutamyl-meso-2,6-diaminoheptandioate ligase n=1 Tax=Bowmanella yangjiangensis TaxID=2811230 RepID=A0ABS3CRX8_9ALTE|nr:UDP-N-acetylmuramate:L-alanyl-gamma-D-glutamyl-meso-diaminopimelate ligase [Bowmanella yangjiangensis]MBN7819269.1 UDP-N-acetylmuramate:L-alanyl-gamma-D-glutamyl-meso-diaminopimelate ligase [Bowmanella yangjiangensis]